MSGICGISRPGYPVTPSMLSPMLSVLAWDNADKEVAASVSAVVGVARRWPFQQAETFAGVSVAFEGELFNRTELEAGVQECAAPVSQLSAAKLIACLYRSYGADFVKLLDGTFAVSVWDEDAGRLLLAIDRLGVQSLYWRKE